MDPESYEKLIQIRLDARVTCVSRHEAGHAMLADALGVKIEYVSIAGLSNPNLSRLGECKLILPYSVSRAIAIALAGEAVDKALSTEQQCKASWMQYETDCERLVERIPKNCTEEAKAFFWQKIHYLRETWVVQWVREHESAIVAFAERLKTQNVLTCAELSIALHESWAERKPNQADLSREVRQIVADTVFLDARLAEPKRAELS